MKPIHAKQAHRSEHSARPLQQANDSVYAKSPLSTDKGVFADSAHVLTPSHIMQLQKTIGNRAVAQLMKSRLQPEVSAPASTPIIQRISYAKGMLSKESWEGYIGSWRNETAQGEWQEIENTYMEIMNGFYQLKQDGTKREVENAELVRQELIMLDQSPIPYSEALNTIKKLGAIRDGLKELLNNKMVRIDNGQKAATSKLEKEKKQKVKKDAENLAVLEYQNKQNLLKEQRDLEESERLKKEKEAEEALKKAWLTFDTDWQEQVDKLKTATQGRNLKHKWAKEFSDFCENKYEGFKKRDNPPLVLDFVSITEQWVKTSNEEERKSGINSAVDKAKKNGLNAERAEKIGTDEKRKDTAAADVVVLLADALVVQQNPHITVWREYLRMDNYRIIGSGQYDGKKIHITFDARSTKQPGPVTSGTADQLRDQLLGVGETFRIHATLEANELADPGSDNGYKNPHYFWGGAFYNTFQGGSRYSGDAAAASGALQTALETYVADSITSKIADAIKKHGDIK